MNIHNSQFRPIRRIGIHNSQFILTFVLLLIVSACSLLPTQQPETTPAQLSIFVTATPTPERPGPTATPAPPPEDLSRYQVAMLPNFAQRY